MLQREGGLDSPLAGPESDECQDVASALVLALSRPNNRIVERDPSAEVLLASEDRVWWHRRRTSH
jgi:hypothetical protein